MSLVTPQGKATQEAQDRRADEVGKLVVVCMIMTGNSGYSHEEIAEMLPDVSDLDLREGMWAARQLGVVVSGSEWKYWYTGILTRDDVAHIWMRRIAARITILMEEIEQKEDELEDLRQEYTSLYLEG